MTARLRFVRQARAPASTVWNVADARSIEMNSTQRLCGQRGSGSVFRNPKHAFQMTIAGQCQRYSGYEMRPMYCGTLRPSRALRLARRRSLDIQPPWAAVPSTSRSDVAGKGAPAAMKHTPAATGRIPRASSPAASGRLMTALTVRSASEGSCSQGCMVLRSVWAFWLAGTVAIKKKVSAPARSCQARVGKL